MGKIKYRKTGQNAGYKYLQALDMIAKSRKKLKLSLNTMGLTEVPNTLMELTQLETLSLTENNICELPATFSRLRNLKSLFLSNNELKLFPEPIIALDQLQLIYIRRNQLTFVPDTIDKLLNLKKLYLMNNKLTSIPNTIGNLTKMVCLNLDHNSISSIPESIGQLKMLETLDLSDNQLTSLPDCLININSLRELYLHGNEQLGIPKEILGPTWLEVDEYKKTPAKPAEILDYYFRTRGNCRPLNEAKLILVGRGAVGKTSLVNQLIFDHFDLGENKTDGINITEWNIMVKDEEEVRLNVWDFGGQEIMHATHQFFLTHRSLYLLVLNGREGGEEADAEYWLKLIESFGDESPVIVVMNKIKDHPFDLNRRALQSKYPAIRDFIKTDCRESVGLLDLRRAIERETDRLEHLRDSFPASWFSIKERLTAMADNFLGFEDYRKICSELGETEKIGQEALATYLHALGVALNYKEDPRLQDTHVLNPHWVTNGIYKVINSEKLERQKGEIRLEDLLDILNPDEYPAAMRCFLFDLMKKFQLCFNFPDDDTHYLIPELLDKQEPPEAAEFTATECLNFQYHYPILPEGLLPRFIVCSHNLSQGLPRWRSGVILSFEGNRALVKADLQDRKVFISVSGSQSGRRRLLAVIRADFEKIHRDIHNLKPEEIVPLPDHPDVVVSYKDLFIMEQSGLKKFQKVVSGQVVELDTNNLLNGVDLEGTRRKEQTMDKLMQPVRLFYSYSHKDESLRNELENHLKIMERRGMIDSWHDRQIGAGDDWKERIDDNLQHADIILVLVSSDFIASDYCYEKEMIRALERHEKKEAVLIPVILRDVNWVGAPFAKIQALPKDAKAVTLWADRDSAWRDVAVGIEKVVADIGKKK